MMFSWNNVCMPYYIVSSIVYISFVLISNASQESWESVLLGLRYNVHNVYFMSMLTLDKYNINVYNSTSNTHNNVICIWYAALYIQTTPLLDEEQTQVFCGSFFLRGILSYSWQCDPKNSIAVMEAILEWLCCTLKKHLYWQQCVYLCISLTHLLYLYISLLYDPR